MSIPVFYLSAHLLMAASSRITHFIYASKFESGNNQLTLSDGRKNGTANNYRLYLFMYFLVYFYLHFFPTVEKSTSSAFVRSHYHQELHDVSTSETVYLHRWINSWVCQQRSPHFLIYILAMLSQLHLYQYLFFHQATLVPVCVCVPPVVLLEWQCFNRSVSGVAVDWKVMIQQKIECVNVCVCVESSLRDSFLHPL